MKIAGVRFRTAGKIYYFDQGDLDLQVDNHVIVETQRGLEYGKVVFAGREMNPKDSKYPIKPIIRKSTIEDDFSMMENKKKEPEAMEVIKEKVKNLGLEMKCLDCEYAFDGSKILFYFSADGRVDFRELARELGSYFHTRIELRQVGVRDEAKIVGGIGICGRELCCKTFLPEFATVGIKMVKAQNLALSSSKISGICGKLKCCLKNEQEAYQYMNEIMPSVGDPVTCPDGTKGMVEQVMPLLATVKVVIETKSGDKELRTYKVDEIKFVKKKKKEVISNQDMQELKELEALEKDESQSNLD